MRRTPFGANWSPPPPIQNTKMWCTQIRRTRLTFNFCQKSLGGKPIFPIPTHFQKSAVVSNTKPLLPCHRTLFIAANGQGGISKWGQAPPVASVLNTQLNCQSKRFHIACKSLPTFFQRRQKHLFSAAPIIHCMHFSTGATAGGNPSNDSDNTERREIWPDTSATTPPKPVTTNGKVGKIKAFLKKYGPIGVGTYFGLYGATLGAFYTAFQSGLIFAGDVVGLIEWLGKKISLFRSSSPTAFLQNYQL